MDAQAESDERGGGESPRFFGLDEAILHDVARHKVDIERRFAQELERKAVRYAEGRDVVDEELVSESFCADELSEGADRHDVVSEALRKELPQAWKLHGVSERVDASNLSAFVKTAIVLDGAIDFGEHIAEDGLHGENNGLRIGSGVGVSLRMFGVGEG